MTDEKNPLDFPPQPVPATADVLIEKNQSGFVEKKKDVDKGIKNEELEKKVLAFKERLGNIQTILGTVSEGILSSGVFEEAQELPMVKGIFVNAQNRQTEIAKIFEERFSQLQSLSSDAITDTSILDRDLEKLEKLNQDLQKYEGVSQKLVESLQSIKEVLPEKVADGKQAVEDSVVNVIKALNDFALQIFNDFEIEKLSPRDKDHLTVLYNLYGKGDFNKVARSYQRAEGYYENVGKALSEKKDLLDFAQADAQLAGGLGDNKTLIDDSLMELFLLKNIFDLDPELYAKTIDNFKLIDQYKDVFGELKKYFKEDLGYEDLVGLKQKVLGLVKNQPSQLKNFLTDNLSVLADAYNKFLTDNPQGLDAFWFRSPEKITAKINSANSFAELDGYISKILMVSEGENNEKIWSNRDVQALIKEAKQTFNTSKIPEAYGLRAKVDMLLAPNRPVGVVDTVIVGDGAVKVSDVNELKKAEQDFSQITRSGEFNSNDGSAVGDYLTDVVLTEKLKTEPKMEVGEDADIVDEVTELKPTDIEYVDAGAGSAAKTTDTIAPPKTTVLDGVVAMPEGKAIEDMGESKLAGVSESGQFLSENVKFKEYIENKLQSLVNQLATLEGVRQALLRSGVQTVGEVKLSDLSYFDKPDLMRRETRQNILDLMDKLLLSGKNKDEVISAVRDYIADTENTLKDLENNFRKALPDYQEKKRSEESKKEITSMLQELKDRSKSGAKPQPAEEVIELSDDDLIEYVDDKKPEKKEDEVIEYPMDEIEYVEDKKPETETKISSFWETNKNFREQIDGEVKNLNASVMIIFTTMNSLRSKGISGVGDINLNSPKWKSLNTLSTDLYRDIEQMIANRENKPALAIKDDIRAYLKKVKKSVFDLQKTLESALTKQDEVIELADEDVIEVGSADDWRNKPIVDSGDANISKDLKFGDLEDEFFGEEKMLPKFKKYERLASLNRRFRNYPEDLEFLQAELAKLPEYRGVKLSKNQILDLWFEDAEKPKDQSKDFIEFIDRALASLEKWKQPKRREPPKLPETKFPTLFQN